MRQRVTGGEVFRTYCATCHVWGEAFARSRDGGDAATVKERIDSLVEFIRQLQVKPLH